MEHHLDSDSGIRWAQNWVLSWVGHLVRRLARCWAVPTVRYSEWHWVEHLAIRWGHHLERCLDFQTEQSWGPPKATQMVHHWVHLTGHCLVHSRETLREHQKEH